MALNTVACDRKSAKSAALQPNGEESFLRFVARQWSSYCFAILDPVRSAVLMFGWRYGCHRCNLKRFRRAGRGCLCARHFGELRRDIRKLVAHLAAEGYCGDA